MRNAQLENVEVFRVVICVLDRSASFRADPENALCPIDYRLAGKLMELRAALLYALALIRFTVSGKSTDVI